jgi:hypothetical protein
VTRSKAMAMRDLFGTLAELVWHNS